MISSTRFTWIPGLRELVADLSDLNGNDFCRAYPDACDTGILVVSHVTGKEVMFAQTHEVRDVEGELLYLEFKPTPQAVRKVPAVKGVTIKLFND